MNWHYLKYGGPLFVLAVLSQTLYPLAADTLQFTTINYSPFTCDPTKENGLEGVVTELVRAAFKSKGIELTVTEMPFLRAVKAVENGQYDGLVITNKDLAPTLLYPPIPNLGQPVCFFIRTNDSWRYKDTISLRNIRVAHVDGYGYADADLDNYFTLHQKNKDRIHLIYGTNTTEQGFRILLGERGVTTFVDGGYSAQYTIMKLGLKDSVSVAGCVRGIFYNYTAFNPKNPRSKKYAALLTKTIREYNRSGKMKEILKKYGIED